MALHNNEGGRMNKILKPKIVIAIISVIAVGVIYWLSTHAFLEIVTSSSNIIITNQDTGNSTELVAGNRVLLKTGLYQVETISDKGSSYSVVEVGRFLTTKTYTTTEEQQSSRSFIGDNPSGCMNLIKNELISFDCAGDINDIFRHVPASGSTPTYKINVAKDLDPGQIKGHKQTLSGAILFLVYQPVVEVELTGLDPYKIYRLELINNSAVLSLIETPTELKAGKEYLLSTYGDKTLIHDKDFSELFEINDDGLLKQLTNPETKDANLSRIGLYFKDSEFIEALNKDADSITTPNKSVDNEVILPSGKKKNFKDGLYKLNYCGNYICTLSKSGDFHVYDMQFKQMRKLIGIRNFYSTKETAKLVTDRGILNYNLLTSSGFYLFVFGAFNYKDISVTDGSSILSIGLGGRSYGLLVDDSKKEVDFIERTIGPLTENEYVDTVSIYKDRIYISPELGELQYSAESDGLDYLPENKQKAKSNINDLLDSLKVDESYKVIINNIQN